MANLQRSNMTPSMQFLTSLSRPFNLVSDMKALRDCRVTQFERKIFGENVQRGAEVAPSLPQTHEKGFEETTCKA